MTSNDWIAALDEWVANGGAFPKQHDISTADEAHAVCRALRSPRIFDKLSYSTIALYQLAVCFQDVDEETSEAVTVFREDGLPILRELLDAGLNTIAETLTDDDDEPILEAYLFIVKILAMYQDAANAALIIKAARTPLQPDDYLWNNIFSIVSQGHPGAVEICGALADPLPNSFIGVVYLDLANALANAGQITSHPFDCLAGRARLKAYLALDQYDGDPSKAIGATVACAFIDKDNAATLLAQAMQHPDPTVQTEVAWALAKRGDETGVARLVEMARDPRRASTAINYLKELGYEERIPPEAEGEEFRVLAEISEWLAHPAEIGRAPDALEIYDNRELFWPPLEDRLPLWLVKYRYEATDDEEAQEGIGLVGSTTFVLFGATNPSMPPEDVYALHCCYELHWTDDPREPEELTVAQGRKILAAHNPGF